MIELLKRIGIDPAQLNGWITRDLQTIVGGTAPQFELTALAGGASVRSYARLRLDPGVPDDSLVLMVLSDPDPAKGVEEVMAEGAITELPFVNVHRHLEAAGVAVPKIHHYNRDRGLLYLEDLGDVHLRNVLEAGDDLEIIRVGEAALRELAVIHVDAANRESSDFLSFKVRFDRKLLRWELDHFTQHAIDARFPGKLTDRDRAAISRHFDRIVDELLAGPYTLSHRDYMLDNLLIKDNAIRVIDFQDALMGPLCYDLACLLFDRDASALMGPDNIEHLVRYYRAEYERRSGRELECALYRRNFDLCVIHRLLKVVGRFHFIDQVKKRPDFLRFIPFMLPAIAEYLGRDPKGAELLAIIRRYLPELKEV